MVRKGGICQGPSGLYCDVSPCPVFGVNSPVQPPVRVGWFRAVLSIPWTFGGHRMQSYSFLRLTAPTPLPQLHHLPAEHRGEAVVEDAADLCLGA